MERLILILLLSNIFSQHDSHHPVEEAVHSVSWLDSWLIPDPGLFFWTLVTFFIVLFILKAKAWGPLMAALDDREKRINEALSSAAKAKEEAEKVSNEYDDMIKKAQKEAQEIVAKGKESGENLKNDIELKAKVKADELMEKAKKEIEAEKSKAIDDIKSASIDLAIQAASKVINKNLDDATNKDIAKSTIDEAN